MVVALETAESFEEEPPLSLNPFPSFSLLPDHTQKNDLTQPHPFADLFVPFPPLPRHPHHHQY